MVVVCLWCDSDANGYQHNSHSNSNQIRIKTELPKWTRPALTARVLTVDCLRVYCSHACTTLKSNHFNELTWINLCFLCVIILDFFLLCALFFYIFCSGSRYHKENQLNFFSAYSWIISFYCVVVVVVVVIRLAWRIVPFSYYFPAALQQR